MRSPRSGASPRCSPADGLKGLDGTAWYHPQRLTLDSGAVAAGNANPAQAVLGRARRSTADDLSKRLRIYAFGAALGGQRVLDAAKLLASQSGIPKRQPEAGGARLDLLAQRPELGESEERLRQVPDPVPREDRPEVDHAHRVPYVHRDPGGGRPAGGRTGGPGPRGPPQAPHPDDLPPRGRGIGRAVRVPGAALHEQRVPAELHPGGRIRLDLRGRHARGRLRPARRRRRRSQEADRAAQGRPARALARHDPEPRVPGLARARGEHRALREHRRPDGRLASRRRSHARHLGRPRDPGPGDRGRDQRDDPEPDPRAGGHLRGDVRAHLQVLHRPPSVEGHRCSAPDHPVGTRGAVPAERRRGRALARDLGCSRRQRAAEGQAPGRHARHRRRRLVGPRPRTEERQALRVRPGRSGCR